MRTQLLAAVASFAFVATGVAFAQDNTKQDNRPAAPAARQEAPRADTQRMQAPKAADNEGMKGDVQKPRAAQGSMQRKDDAQAQPGAMQRRDNAEAQPGAMQRRDNAEAQPGAMQREDNAQAEPGAMQRKDNARMGKPGDKDRTAQDRGEPRVTGKVNISHEHVARVGEALRREGRPERVDIDIRVGARVPERIAVRPLPAEVIALVPEYRGYNYFLDDNDEIVFVSPETNEIVGTIDYEGRAASDDAPRVAGARPCPIEN